MPLQNYLKKSTSSHVALTFNEIEIILNAPLPKSAYKYKAWWVNSRNAHSHASTWLEANYIVGEVKFGEYVKFISEENEGNQIQKRDSVIQLECLSNEEINYIESLSKKLDKVRNFFTEDMPSNFVNENLVKQHEVIKSFRRIIGNIDNDMSFLGCLLIKEFLNQRHSFSALNMALKPQGSPGLDVDENTSDGKRIIGELKTTFPYNENDLGSNQKSNFIKDFEKLKHNEADYKYFFVTEPKTFDIVQNKYHQYLKGVNLVLLPQAISNSQFIVSYS
ncbi:hypothetical protein KP77_04190 [Jeotgalibacillus alimentarius]|uniref:DUF7662 domain-containing protein n=2 Tax=Jeotgalibacillus alimentarius TaxID=135826 RepID=A0A0C2WBM0_9BACL|nr:hypothetical protein KP77_04190 [Jeotgalibacillus alimentarius]